MITINSITVRLGGRTILDRASAAIPPGGRVGLIGRNGAGKSTLMKVLVGQLDPDEGSVEMPRRTRLGYIAQEAPSGSISPFDAVLSADVERAQLLDEAEHCTEPHRLGDIHDRLLAIDAYTAPSRAAIILTGLGFDEDDAGAAARQLLGRVEDARGAGGAAVLGARRAAARRAVEPPRSRIDAVAGELPQGLSRHADRDQPRARPAQQRGRHILHLQGGKLTLYPGGYDAFETQRAERAAQIAAARASQDAQRARLQDYVARNSARASTAKQAQSRAKMLAKMQPIAALIEDPSLSFDFPNPDEMRPPLITLDLAAVGYDGNPILRRLNLRIDPDDRIALLGRNGNGKTTLARLLAAQLTPLEGAMQASGRMRVGYFTQYQVEELASDDTPLEHMTRAMQGMTPGAVRAQLGRFGFSGNRATTRVGQLSGGERARLALALITRDAPHLLILDEPTNHLDVDAREALVQALNDFDGAVILISHDRHMVELTADRLVLVDDGTAVDYPGSIEDYIDFILGRNQPKAETRPKADKKDRKAAARAREDARQIGKEVSDAEAAIARLQAQASSIDLAMFDPASAAPSLGALTTGELARRRTEVARELERAERCWLAASERLERQSA